MFWILTLSSKNPVGKVSFYALERVKKLLYNQGYKRKTEAKK